MAGSAIQANDALVERVVFLSEFLFEHGVHSNLECEGARPLRRGGSPSSRRSLWSRRVLRINLRGLFPNSRRIDDEFERISVLILFHQLLIREPLGALERIAAWKLCFCGVDQVRC